MANHFASKTACNSVFLACCALSLAACNSSDNDEQPAENIAATQTLLENAEQDWAALNYQGYVFTHYEYPVCPPESDIVVDPAPPSTYIVLDTNDYFAMTSFPSTEEQVSYRRPGLTYPDIHQHLAEVLAAEPVELADQPGSQALPEFDQQGLVDNWYHRLAGAECGYSLGTRNFRLLSEMSYDLVDLLERLEVGHQAWLDQGLMDYSFQVRFIQGSCSAPEISGVATISVIDGTAQTIEWEGEEFGHETPRTLDDLGFIDLAFGMNLNATNISANLDDNSEVEFDTNFGFPLSYVMTFEDSDSCRIEGIIIESLN